MDRSKGGFHREDVETKQGSNETGYSLPYRRKASRLFGVGCATSHLLLFECIVPGLGFGQLTWATGLTASLFNYFTSVT